MHQLLVDLDLMDDLVEGQSCVHGLQRRRDQSFERGGHVVEHARDSLASRDRQAVCGQQQLRLERGHAPERVRPLRGIPLHLLRVAGVGEHPTQEVAGDDRPVLGYPRPRVVVGFPSIVTQLDVEATDIDAQPVVVGDGRLHPAARPPRRAVAVRGRPTAPELSLVDDLVVTGGEVVAGKARRHVEVADDGRAWMATLHGRTQERMSAPDVVNVTMGVDDRVHRRVGPRLQRGDHVTAERLEARIEQHQAVGRAESHDVRERLDHRDVGRHFAQSSSYPLHRRRALVDPVIDEVGRQLEQLGHGTPS